MLPFILLVFLNDPKYVASSLLAAAEKVSLWSSKMSFKAAIWNVYNFIYIFAETDSLVWGT